MEPKRKMPGKAFRIEEKKQCELKAFVGGQQFLTCTLISKLISHDFLCSLSCFHSIFYFCFLGQYKSAASTRRMRNFFALRLVSLSSASEVES